MYECPTTQPMSLVVNIVSPGATQKMRAHRRRRARPRSRRCRAARPWACPSCPTCRGCTTARTTRATRTGTRAPACSRAQRRVVEVAARGRAAWPVEAAVDDDHLRAADGARGAAPRRRAACTGSTLPPRMPASAVTSTFGRASSMRAARLAAAKPPNTTEWIAPMPRAREHREHRLGDHRHVDQHAVAAADALRAQHRRAAVHLVVQLAIRVRARLRPSRSRCR